jgi:hypothetical protein
MPHPNHPYQLHEASVGGWVIDATHHGSHERGEDTPARPKIIIKNSPGQHP